MDGYARFSCPSDTLGLGSLVKRPQHALLFGSVLALLTHLGLTQLRGPEEQERAVRPLTTQFVKRQPRLAKPLELRKRPAPKQRRIRREMVSVKAKVSRHKVSSRIQPVRAVGSLAKPRVEIGRMAEWASVQHEPQTFAGAIEGAKDVEEKIDMSLELLDIEALDTGQYPAMVVQAPDDKKNIRGFCYLAMAELQGAVAPNDYHSLGYWILPGFHRLVRSVNEYTAIKARALGRLTLSDAKLFMSPWVFMTAHHTFKLSDFELENLGSYLVSGGFVFADSFERNFGLVFTPGAVALRANLLAALKTQNRQVSLEKLPNSHPVYHCYFDFEGPPPGCDTYMRDLYPDRLRAKPYLEGIEADGRLVAVYSQKDYAGAWTHFGKILREYDGVRPLQFGINTIIFALTQEGSITNRVMDLVGH